MPFAVTPVHLFLILFMIGVPVAVVVLLIAAVGRSNRGYAPPPAAGMWRPPDPAVQILRERFARGEIDATEFEQKMRQLDQGGGGPQG